MVARLAKKKDICVLQSLVIKRSRGQEEIDRIVNLVMSDRRARVIILFMQVSERHIYIYIYIYCLLNIY